ncbi:hypothetical protein DDV21_007595 [Streptococcus chenjunshii]|uniref:Uncharacterized protein n=1 Tax=Streptococcus chenjunshii TaxID=2173853 RepID=A0A372KNU4_9STRE|nr:hypothetical protein [Streptococcus chenjunshii]AXQ78957.1 hypothetical protein DDV21_007595 [Streptococcus chenjunshii]RFU51384.1 hypothetical protein DDV22_03485 [Streptococcus chenjunshii]RFU53584.1 hypothetical protein DDV23_03475 [Streptococcus chenjunshii]
MVRYLGSDAVPAWVVADVEGGLQSMGNAFSYGKALFTDKQTRSAAWASIKTGAAEAWQNFKEDPWYQSGGVVFEVASWLIGAGEIKAGFQAAKGSKSFLSGAKAFSKAVGQSAARIPASGLQCSS